jgi:hypothetical protein
MAVYLRTKNQIDIEHTTQTPSADIVTGMTFSLRDSISHEQR